MSETNGKILKSGLIWWPLAAGAFLLDQFTKWLIQAHLGAQDTIHVLPVLDIVSARNYGAAFSVFDIPGGVQRWIFTAFALLVSVLIIVALRRVSSTQRLQCMGLMLIVSGALGNALDRIRHSYVVDFILVHWKDAWFPAFNVADSCITIGAGLILLDAILDWRRTQRVAKGQVR